MNNRVQMLTTQVERAIEARNSQRLAHEGCGGDTRRRAACQRRLDALDRALLGALRNLDTAQTQLDDAEAAARS